MHDLDQAITELVDSHRPPVPPAFSVLRARQRRRARSRQVACAAAVAAAVTALVAVPTALGRSQPTQPAGAPAIPFSSMRAQGTDAPPPQSLANVHGGPGIGDCNADQLQLSIRWQQNGHDLLGEAAISFRPYLAPRTKAACWLQRDEPRLVLVGPLDGPTGPSSRFAGQPEVANAPVTPRRVVSDAQPVILPLRLTGSNCVQSSVGSLVGLTPGFLQASFTGDPLPCVKDSPPRDGELTIGLPHSSDEPAALVPVDRQSLQVSLDVPAQATESDAVSFLVHLKNPTDKPISLTPCPAYGLVVGRADSEGSSTSGRTGHLNCREAPAAVAPGQELSFEMLADDPAAGQPGAHDATQLRVMWGISGPANAEAVIPLLHPKASADPASSAEPVAADARRTVFRGLAIDVPRAWPDDRARCGTPVEDTVLHGDGGFTSCAVRPAPAVSYVEFRAPFVNGQPCTPAGQGPITRCATQDSVGRTVIVMRLAANEAEAVVVSPDQALAERLAGTARAVTDDAGCAVRPDQLGPAAGNGTGDGLVPADPSSATVCRWSGGLLARTNQLAGQDLSAFVTAVRLLKPGLATAPTANGNPAPGDPRCAAEASRAIRVRLHYPAGADKDVWLRLTGCGPVIGFSDGEHTALPSSSAIGPILQAVGFDTGFPDISSLQTS
ncbi:MAG: hypothetical protein LC789_12690 [Actinobacteria bacterium]|nr:hypothetical protein [Actinomycetota bacterium]